MAADLACMSVDDLCNEVDRVTLSRREESSSAANNRQGTTILETDCFDRELET